MRATIRPLRVVRYDRDIDAYRMSVYGYRAVCECGWDSGKQPTVGLARLARRQHLESDHAPQPKGHNG